MAYITQAGVGLGLAKEVAVAFPGWGDSFATLLISVITINQIVGPPLLKWAIHYVKEARPRQGAEADLARRALIFGLDDNSLAVARDLERHGWDVKVASRQANDRVEEVVSTDVDIEPIQDMELSTLRKLGAGQSTALIAMLGDEQNLHLCRLATEHFDIDDRIAVVHDREKVPHFHEQGVLVAEPDTALVSLVSHLVRSPSATSLLLGLEAGQDMEEFEVRNRHLRGVALRDLKLPLDVLVLSVHREERQFLCHGFTRLELGDKVTVVGSSESLEELGQRFES
jgi:Trk K+ transport system NAD-binding subunit